jgi:hypothetical protein
LPLRLSLFCHRPRQPARASPASSLLSGHIGRASSRQPRNVSTVLPPCFSSFSSLALRTSFLCFDFPQLALSASASPALSIRLATRQPNAKKPTNSSEDVPAALLHQERQGRGRVSSLKFEKQELSACDQQASLLITAISSLSTARPQALDEARGEEASRSTALLLSNDCRILLLLTKETNG